MARLTEAQIKKLTPEQRKARAKRLAYGRAYDASKRDGKSVKRTPAAKSAKMKITETASERLVSAKIKALVAELESVEERALEILKQIREIE